MLERRTTSQITKNKIFYLDLLYFLRIDWNLADILLLKVIALIMSISYLCKINKIQEINFMLFRIGQEIKIQISEKQEIDKFIY